MNKTNKQPIKVLDLRDSPWVDGPGRTILDCAQSLEGDNFHFIIGGFSGGVQKTNAYTDEAKKRGLETISIEENSAFDLNVLRQIMHIIKTYEIDIVHTHDFRSDLFGLICAKLCRKPIIATVHGWIANDKKGKVYTWVDKQLLRFMNHIISVSKRTAGLARKSGIADKKITVINNALKLENYSKNKKHGNIRKELGFSEEDILAANIGRLSPEKGQLEFLQAGKALLKENENIKLLLIGVGPDQARLEKYVSENKMEQAVIFMGFRNDMVDIYNDIDLVIQSSYTEGMPNVILESLLMAVPVIATDVGGTAEIVEHEKTGVLLKAGDTSALIDKIRDYLTDSEKYSKMAEAGENVIKTHFSHEGRIRQLAEQYNQLMVAR